MNFNPDFLPKHIQKQIPGTSAYAEERENNLMKNEVNMANHQIQKYLLSLKSKLNDNEKFKIYQQEASKRVVQSAIVPLKYANNFENINVLYDSLLLMFRSILLLEKGDKFYFDSRFPMNVVNRFGRQKNLDINLLENLHYEVNSYLSSN